MNTLTDFIQNYIITDNPLLQAIVFGVLFLLIYDFYHGFFSAVFTWFKK